MIQYLRPLVLLAVTVVVTTSALAGPPLICQPYNIGDAKSLPFRGPSWSAIDPAYDVRRLVDDTLALLTPDAPILVRMETLRRATVYARHDAQLAEQLLARLQARTTVQQTNSPSYALGLFDAGFLTETYRQAAWISKNAKEKFWEFRQRDPQRDGYAMVRRALSMRGNDPAMEFAAAMITIDSNKEAHGRHLQRAVAGAAAGSLLSQNLATHFRDEVREQQRTAQRRR